MNVKYMVARIRAVLIANALAAAALSVPVIADADPGNKAVAVVPTAVTQTTGANASCDKVVAKPKRPCRGATWGKPGSRRRCR